MVYTLQFCCKITQTKQYFNIIYLCGMLVTPMYQISDKNCDHEQDCNHHVIVL